MRAQSGVRSLVCVPGVCIPVCAYQCAFQPRRFRTGLQPQSCVFRRRLDGLHRNTRRSGHAISIPSEIILQPSQAVGDLAQPRCEMRTVPILCQMSGRSLTSITSITSTQPLILARSGSKAEVIIVGSEVIDGPGGGNSPAVGWAERRNSIRFFHISRLSHLPGSATDLNTWAGRQTRYLTSHPLVCRVTSVLLMLLHPPCCTHKSLGRNRCQLPEV